MNFCKAIKRVKHAASTDDTRENLKAIRFEAQDDGAVVVATDGHRLAVDYTDSQISTRTVPIKFALMARTVAGLEDSEHKYPDWMHVIPVRFTIEVEVDFGKFSDLIREIYERTKNDYKILDWTHKAEKHEKQATQLRNRIAHLRKKSMRSLPEVSSEPSPNIGIIMSYSAGVISVRTKHDADDQRLEVSVIETDGKSIQIGVNAQYLLDIVKSHSRSHKKIRLSFVEPLSPLRIHVPNGGLDIVMPMRL